MIEVLRFIFSYIVQFISMLFTIDLGNNLNLGLLLCIIFIFLPMMLRIINFLKLYANDVTADELADLKFSRKRGDR